MHRFGEKPYSMRTAKNDIVLDPFMGSGQTAIAAVKSKRHYIGYEIDEKYVALAQKRIQENKP